MPFFNRGPMVLILAVSLLMISSTAPIIGLEEGADDTTKLYWTQQFGTIGEDGATSIAVDDSGNAYVAGNLSGALSGQHHSGLNDAFVRKYDSNGKEVWTRLFGSTNNDIIHDLGLDAAGNIYVAGQINFVPSSDLSDAFVRKFDKNGGEQWSRYLSTDNFVIARSLGVDEAGNVYVSGGTTGTFSGQFSSGSGDAFVRKYNKSGEEQWTRQFGTGGYECAFSIAVDLAGNSHVTGITDGVFPAQIDLSGNDVFVRKYDNSGKEQWTRQFGSRGSDGAKAAALDADGNLYLAGYTTVRSTLNYYADNTEAFVRLYNQEGIEKWTIRFGTGGWDAASSIVLESSGNFYVAGQTDGTFPDQVSSGGLDSFIRKYDRNGVRQWTKQFGSLDKIVTYDVAGDNTGNLWVAGIINGVLPDPAASGDYDAFVAKFAVSR